ncbi:MAG TPA: Uma2 family endonuclease [Anaerolineae bacterium]|nr:Uma2 family endonuclease [Anaerolineae bacterium]
MAKVKEASAKYNAERRFTPDEYLAHEIFAEFKSEYYDGKIVAMAGASRDHNVIVGNTITALNAALENKPCKVYPSDMRLQLKRRQAYLYPDVMVVCGKPEFGSGRDDTVINPIVIIEVLSASTHNHDRVKKFALYKPIGSLQAYLMIDSEQVHVTYLQREPNSRTWTIEMFDKLKDVVRLDFLDCMLPLRRIYNKVEL